MPGPRITGLSVSEGGYAAGPERSRPERATIGRREGLAGRAESFDGTALPSPLPC